LDYKSTQKHNSLPQEVTMKTFVRGLLVSLTVAGLLLMAAPTAQALILIASDDSSQSPYDDGWATTDNGGFGFSSWVLQSTGGNAGQFQGSAAGNDAGGPVVPYIDVGGDSFGMFGNSGDRAAGYRGFDFNADLSLDGLPLYGVVRWGMDNGGVDEASSSVGLSLRSGNATGDATDATLFSGRRFGFEFQQGAADYKIIDNSGIVGTGIAWRRTGLALEFTLTGLDTYALQVTDVATGLVLSNYTGTLAGSAGSYIESFSIYDRFAGTTSDRDLFFNSFQILSIPEPSTVVLLLGGGGLLWAGWRRWRR